MAAPLLMALTLCLVARAERALFLMSGPWNGSGSHLSEAYVVAVEDASLIEQARQRLAAGRQTTYLVPRVRIAPEPSEENINYAEPGHPSWPWHATELVEWIEWDPFAVRTADYLPERDGVPSGVAALLRDGKGGMYLVDFPLVMELSPSKPGGVSNLSTRGWVGTGERVLIGGFVVHGGLPRNLLIRGIGPSLARFGIQEPLANPTITVFSGSTKVATNDNWEDGNLQTYLTERIWITVVPHPAEWMKPGNPLESALFLSLPPGAYTVHVSEVSAGQGVAMVELFDLDAR